MNILTKQLPDFVELDGKEYKVHTDFKNWIDISIMLIDKKDELDKNIAKIIKKAYIECPPNISLALKGILKFFNAEEDKQASTKESSHKKRIFSFEYDATYILSAFREQYNIDLLKENMHWFEFLAYFKSLNEDVQLMKIMQYRSVDLSQIKDKTQKAHLRKMKNIYFLPDNRTEEEKEAEMMSALENFF